MWKWAGKVFNAAADGIGLLTSSFAPAGEKRQREEEEGEQQQPQAGAVAAAGGGRHAGHAVTVNQHVLDDPPSKRQRVHAGPAASLPPAPAPAPAHSGFASPAAAGWKNPAPPGPAFPRERVDYTTARHVPRTSVNLRDVGSRRSAFSSLGAEPAGGDRASPASEPAAAFGALGAAANDDPRQARINASLAQFKLTADLPTTAGAADSSAEGPRGPASGAGEPLGICFIPPPSDSARSSPSAAAPPQRAANPPATLGWNKGTDFWTPPPAGGPPAGTGHAVGARPSVSPSVAKSAPSGGQSRSQKRAATEKDSLELYKTALHNMNLAQYDERRRERESRVQQIEAQMLRHKQDQHAEAERGRAAQTEKVHMLENASKQAKKELAERMAERLRVRRVEEEEARRREEEEQLELSKQRENAQDEQFKQDDSDDPMVEEEEDSEDHGSYDDPDEDGDEDEDDEDEEEDDEVGGYPTITNEQQIRAQEVMDGGDPGEIIQSKMMGSPAAEINIHRHHLQCLQHGEWLNDEVINVWMDYIKDRNERLNGLSASSMPSIYIMKTLFYSRMCVLEGPAGRQDCFDFPGVRRWTKKVDVFAHDMIFIPLHQGMHWALAVVNMRAKKIQYFDSMGGHAKSWLDNVKRWVAEESLHKKKVEFDFSGWDVVSAESCPQQHNGYDCGVFMCQFVKHVASHLEPTPCSFEQRDMPMIRWQMVHEIVTGSMD